MHRDPGQLQQFPPRGAALFYGVNVTSALISAAVILIPGAPLLAIALNANVLATVLLPVTLVSLMMLASDRELMGKWANTRVTNIPRDPGDRFHRALRGGLRNHHLPPDHPPHPGLTPRTPDPRRTLRSRQGTPDEEL